ncbi:MAG: hypothetical protein RL189_3364 [Pseudomonadota bacterium]|jgi:hypothetical protein
MKEHSETLSKGELQELDALLTKLMLYLHSTTEPDPASKDPPSIIDPEKIPSEEELLRRF